MRFPTVFHTTHIQCPCYEGMLQSQDRYISNLTTVDLCMHFQLVVVFLLKLPVRELGLTLFEGRMSL